MPFGPADRRRHCGEHFHQYCGHGEPPFPGTQALQMVPHDAFRVSKAGTGVEATSAADIGAHTVAGVAVASPLTADLVLRAGGSGRPCTSLTHAEASRRVQCAWPWFVARVVLFPFEMQAWGYAHGAVAWLQGGAVRWYVFQAGNTMTHGMWVGNRCFRPSPRSCKALSYPSHLLRPPRCPTHINLLPDLSCDSACVRKPTKWSFYS